MQSASSKSGAFLEVIQDNLWCQHVTQPTRLDSILDLVITSNPDTIDEVVVLAHLGTSDHNMLSWETNYYMSNHVYINLRETTKMLTFNQIRTELKK